MLWRPQKVILPATLRKLLNHCIWKNRPVIPIFNTKIFIAQRCNFLPFCRLTFGILLYVLTLNFIGIIKLEKIKTERNLEEQIKNVLQYKKLFHWGYITGYPIVTIFLGVFFYNYHQWWMVLTISILMLMAILTDYFLFHYVSDRIKELTQVNKELAELKEEHKE